MAWATPPPSPNGSTSCNGCCWRARLTLPALLMGHESGGQLPPGLPLTQAGMPAAAVIFVIGTKKPRLPAAVNSPMGRLRPWVRLVF